jgi:hypothetical protein
VPLVSFAGVAGNAPADSLPSEGIRNFHSGLGVKRPITDQHGPMNVHRNCVRNHLGLLPGGQCLQCDGNAQNDTLAATPVFTLRGGGRSILLGFSSHLEQNARLKYCVEQILTGESDWVNSTKFHSTKRGCGRVEHHAPVSVREAQNSP